MCCSLFLCYRYSATTNAEKAKLKEIWTNKWNEFLDQVLEKYGEKYRIHISSFPCPCDTEEPPASKNIQASNHNITNPKIQIIFIIALILYWRMY